MTPKGSLKKTVNTSYSRVTGSKVGDVRTMQRDKTNDAIAKLTPALDYGMGYGPGSMNYKCENSYPPSFQRVEQETAKALKNYESNYKKSFLRNK